MKSHYVNCPINNVGESKGSSCSYNKLSKGPRESLTASVPLQEVSLIVNGVYK